MKKFSRRMVLGGGAAALGSLWLPGLGVVQAQNDPVSKRKLLFIYAEAGWVTRHVDMRPPWAPAEWSQYQFYDPKNDLIPDDLEWEFSLADSRLTEEDFPRILRPLYRHRDIMTVTEGPAMLTSALDEFGDGHAKAHMHAWTGVPAAASEGGFASRSAAPSTDQRIAEFIQQSDPGHRSMDFRIGPATMAHEFLWRSDAAGGAAKVAMETSPQAAYDRFFGGVSSGDPIAANARVSLGVALKQFDELAPRLLGDDRKKLEAHRQILGALERQYGAAVSCDSVTRPPTFSDFPTGQEVEDKALAFANIVAAGFACGLSRVANIGSISPSPDAYGLPPETNIHHEYEHEIGPERFFQNPDQAWFDKEEAMVRRNILQTEYVAKIIDVLRAVPDGDGTLLDSTLVVYMSELAHGVHGSSHYPTIFFGGDGGIVTPGRYIKYAENVPIPYDLNYGRDFLGPPHSRILVAILQGFGLPLDHLGVSTLDGYATRVRVSQTIDLAGPLPRLKV